MNLPVLEVSDYSAVPAATGTGEVPLLRGLGFWTATAIVIGSMIGSAIFVVPAEIARQVGSRSASLAVWLVAGGLSLFGALCFAELAAMMPRAGGQYVYLREAYGSLTSFLCGWVFFVAAQSGGIAAVAMGLARYLTIFLPLSGLQQRVAAGGVIILLTAINYCGVRKSGCLQSMLTGMNVGIVIVLITLGYVLAHRSLGSAVPKPIEPNIRSWASFGVATAAALWAYDGWNSLTFVAGEVRRPETNLPVAMFVGTAIVVVLYVGLNIFYYYVLSPWEIAQSQHVAADAVSRILGPKGSHLVSLAIVISAFGSANVSILAGARVYYAMAKDGLFFGRCATVHPRFRTPYIALAAQATWAVLLICVAGYEQLFTYTVFAAWVFYALAGIGVIILRIKKPNATRPYRVLGYPWVPLIFVLGALLFIINTLIEKPVQAGWGCLLLALGVPIYLIWHKTEPTVAN